MFDQRRDKAFPQGPERALIAEEVGHVDEQIVEELLDFLFVATQKIGVLPQVFDPVQRHSPLNSAL